MKPVAFPGHNAVMGAAQDEYVDLPAWKNPEGHDGRVITCWRMGWWERIKFVFGGVIWHHQLTFQNHYQPISLSLDYPWSKPLGEEDELDR